MRSVNRGTTSLPIDKLGADLLFQIISERYERGSIVVTINRAFKRWPEIFNQDTTLTSALLDRLLHHAEKRKGRRAPPTSYAEERSASACAE